jgi:hypothetical protein
MHGVKRHCGIDKVHKTFTRDNAAARAPWLNHRQAPCARLC